MKGRGGRRGDASIGSCGVRGEEEAEEGAKITKVDGTRDGLGYTVDKVAKFELRYKPVKEVVEEFLAGYRNGDADGDELGMSTTLSSPRPRSPPVHGGKEQNIDRFFKRRHLGCTAALATLTFLLPSPSLSPTNLALQQLLPSHHQPPTAVPSPPHSSTVLAGLAKKRSGGHG